MTLDEVQAMQAQKDDLMRNGYTKDALGGLYGDDPNGGQVTPYPY